jgi:hypothetical protein
MYIAITNSGTSKIESCRFISTRGTKRKKYWHTKPFRVTQQKSHEKTWWCRAFWVSFWMIAFFTASLCGLCDEYIVSPVPVLYPSISWDISWHWKLWHPQLASAWSYWTTLAATIVCAPLLFISFHNHACIIWTIICIPNHLIFV